MKWHNPKTEVAKVTYATYATGGMAKVAKPSFITFTAGMAKVSPPRGGEGDLLPPTMPAFGWNTYATTCPCHPPLRCGRGVIR